MSPDVSSSPSFDRAFCDDLERLFAWPRDVRRFSSCPLPSGALEQLVALTAYAPPVGYSQPSRFVSVCDTARRTAVIDDYERANAEAEATYPNARRATYTALKLAGLREAPVHLAVFVDTATTRGEGLGRRSMPEMLAYSTVLAVHTFWFAARARGIGVGWVSIVDPGVVARARASLRSCRHGIADSRRYRRCRVRGYLDFESRSSKLRGFPVTILL